MRNPVPVRDLGHVKHISHDEIFKLTEYTSQSHYIQKSPYGRLFRGRMMGKDVVVKKWDLPLPIPRYYWDYPQRFASQLELGLNKDVVSHLKVAKLIGFCCEKILALVWDLKLNQTLHDLIPQDKFTWAQRMNVAGQVAETLDYFHNNKIAICNFFSPCISVDQDYNIQLFELDYSVNLANEYPMEERTWWKHPSYYAPEAERAKFPDDFEIGWFYASDVYHFGLLLLELTLAKCVLNDVVWVWVESAKKSFEKAGTRKPLDTKVKIFELAMKCLQGKPMLRPRMAEVFREFCEILLI